MEIQELLQKMDQLENDYDSDHWKLILEVVKECCINPVELVWEQLVYEEGVKEEWISFEEVEKLLKVREEKFGSMYGKCTESLNDRWKASKQYFNDLGIDGVLLEEPDRIRIRIKFKRGGGIDFKNQVLLYGFIGLFSQSVSQGLHPQFDWTSDWDEKFVYHEIRFNLHYGS